MTNDTIRMAGALALVVATTIGAGCASADSSSDATASFTAAPGIGGGWERAGSTLLPRGLHTLAFDEARGSLVLFGGVNASRQGETFLQTPDGSSFQRVSPANAPPTRHRGQAMAYDPVRKEIVLFGGKDENGPLDDTWLWNGTTWRKANPSQVPLGRQAHAMVWDAARQRIVMFGGYSWGAHNDTWTWDGQQWTEASPASAPPARQNFQMAYDARREKVVAFGGYGDAERLADTWTWDGSTWSEVPIAQESAPRARYDHALAWDQARERVVLFAGNSKSGWLNDLWSFDGERWVQSSAPSAPPTRYRGQSMVYDAKRDRAILFGGFGPAAWINDTWSFDGARWRELFPARAPSVRFGHAMVYDETREQPMLFGGYGVESQLADTWIWNDGGWTEVTPDRSPPGRDDHALAFDRERRVSVVFGGRLASYAPANDTWTWDGKSWSEAAVTVAPPARYKHALAYDPVRKNVVLFGGLAANNKPLGDTWTWDGSSWKEASDPGPKPEARLGHTLVYAPALQKVVLFGGASGANGASRLGDTWAWDGTSWTRIELPAGPGPRLGHAVTLDTRRGAIVLFGGQGDGPIPELNDTWTWSGR